MSEITQIEQVMRHKYRIYIDGDAAFMLTGRQLDEWGLREGDELDDEQAERLEGAVYKMAVNSALDLLAKRDYSEAGLKRKLADRGFSSGYADEAVQYVRSYDYIDDRRYADEVIREHFGRMSRMHITALLLGKGVDKAVIEEELSLSGWNDEDGIIFEIRKKYPDENKLFENSENNPDKFIASLVRKGYRYADIRHVIDKTGSMSNIFN